MSSDLVNLYIQQYEQYLNETDIASKDNFKKLNSEIYSIILQDMMEMSKPNIIYLVYGYQIVDKYILLNFVYPKQNKVDSMMIHITFFISKYKLNEINNTYIDDEYYRKVIMSKEMYEKILNSLKKNKCNNKLLNYI
jgi:hypothetical protein